MAIRRRPPVEGEVLAALTRAGLFRGTAVLVGTIAFQCYAGLLSIHLPEASYRTADIDLAPAPSSLVVTAADAVDPEALLRMVDPSFAALFHPGNERLPVGFENATGYRVEVLAPVRRADEAVRTFAGLAAVGARALKCLDYLIEEPRDGLILHKAGLGVRVPAPGRYAVHKLLIADLRRVRGRPRRRRISRRSPRSWRRWRSGGAWTTSASPGSTLGGAARNGCGT